MSWASQRSWRSLRALVNRVTVGSGWNRQHNLSGSACGVRWVEVLKPLEPGSWRLKVCWSRLLWTGFIGSCRVNAMCHWHTRVMQVRCAVYELTSSGSRGHIIGVKHVLVTAATSNLLVSVPDFTRQSTKTLGFGCGYNPAHQQIARLTSTTETELKTGGKPVKQHFEIRLYSVINLSSLKWTTSFLSWCGASHQSSWKLWRGHSKLLLPPKFKPGSSARKTGFAFYYTVGADRTFLTLIYKCRLLIKMSKRSSWMTWNSSLTCHFRHVSNTHCTSMSNRTLLQPRALLRQEWGRTKRRSSFEQSERSNGVGE